jgi:predicted flap endonuclease-1-like 5' DNA nuclease
MSRVLRWLLASLLVLFGGVLVLGLLLWWLSQRERGEMEEAVIEIEIPPGSLIGKPPVAGTAAVSPAAPPAAVEVEREAPVPKTEAGPDDLRRIEGIGPKISRVLQAAGITTFAQLAAAQVDEIERILEAEDPRLGRLADPGTWPEQARLAADGDWEELVALQAQLKGGRRMDKSG